MQNLLRYFGIKGNVSSHQGAGQLEDCFEVLGDANDQFLERVVSGF